MINIRQLNKKHELVKKYILINLSLSVGLALTYIAKQNGVPSLFSIGELAVTALIISNLAFILGIMLAHYEAKDKTIKN